MRRAVHTMHGTSFTAYASPDRGSQELCAWRIEIPGHTMGIPHHVSREEVLYVLGGTIQASVDGRAGQAAHNCRVRWMPFIALAPDQAQANPAPAVTRRSALSACHGLLELIGR